LSLAEEDVTFPRMNYQRKKLSLKERLEEALEEIGDESLKAQNSSVKCGKRGSARSNEVLPSFASGTLKPPSECGIDRFEISRTGPDLSTLWITCGLQPDGGPTLR
jgi:hypothetical protein